MLLQLKKLLLCLLLCLPVLKGYGERFDFVHYSTNNSQLPHDICYELTQDEPGYLWIATDDGLVRFDGRDMKVYQKGFKSRFVIATAAYDSLFFIATWKGGVHRLYHDSIVPLHVAEPSGLAFENSNDILLCKDLVVLYTFDQVSIFRYNARSQTLHPANIRIAAWGQPARPLKWQGTELRYCTVNDRLVAYNQSGVFRLEDTLLRQVSAQGYDQLFQTPDGAIYGLSHNKLYRLPADLRSCTLYRDMPAGVELQNRTIKWVYLLASGNMVLQMSDPFHQPPSFSASGLYVFVNFRTGEVTDLSKALGIHVLIADILPDKHGGGFWISTDGDGLYQVFEPRYQQYGNEGEFRNPYITALACDSGQLYIGTRNGIYTLRHNRIRLLYDQYMVYSFFRNKQGQLFARSRYRTGDIRLMPEKAVKEPETYACYTTPHYSIREFFDPFYICNDVSSRTGRMQLSTPALAAIAPLKDFCEDARGRVWMAGNDFGLYTWDSTMKAPVQFRHPLLRQNGINQLLPDTAGGIWVASKNGLLYLKDNQVLVRYDDNNGLASSCVNTLLRYKDQLWIGTQAGLNMLDLHTRELITCKKYDGLVANDVTVLLPYTGDLIAVGCSKGVTLIDAARPGFNKQRPVLVTGPVYIGSKQAEPTASSLTAGYRERVTIHYNVISFMYPELIRFRYRLSPQDQWIETGNKSLVFTNLEPRHYELELQAKTYNSDWCAPVHFMLTVKDPWWMTVPFFLCCIVLVAAIVLLIIRSRERRYKQKALMKQQFSELKLKALQTQLNPHFISNTLNAIQLLSMKNEEIATSDALTRFAHLTRMLLESSSSRFITLRDELEITGHYLELEQLRFHDRFSYTITVDEQIDTRSELVPGVLLQPFIENSINHGIANLSPDRRGLISIIISKQEEVLYIQITDNGIGRRRANELRQQSGRPFRSRSSDIMDGISQAVNDLPGNFIRIETADICDKAGQVAGTRVQIRCNIHHSYTLQT